MVDIVNAGGARDQARIPLATRLGTPIRNVRRRESAPDTLRASVRQWTHQLPAAELRSITATYNCFGMVFADRRTWVFEETLSLIFTEDGYRKTLHPGVGDVVVYRSPEGDIEHVGVLMEIRPLVIGSGTQEFIVLSKWGAEGEYLHRRDHVPIRLGAPTEYWTERREVS